MKRVTGFLVGLVLMPSLEARADYLLSSYPGATILLSMTQENAAYSGPAFRVRRNSDNAQMDIPFVGKDADVATFNAFCGSVKCYMTVWYDQSGNSNNCVQATAGRQWLVTVDVDGKLSPNSRNRAQGCQIAESPTYKTAQPEGFVVLRGYTNETIDETVFGYLPAGSDSNEPTSGRDHARFALGWSIYDYIYMVPVRNGDGAYYTNYWTKSRQAYTRANTNEFTVWDYSAADHQVRIGNGFVVVQPDDTNGAVTYPKTLSMMVGNTPSYNGGYQGSIRAFVLYAGTQPARDSISGYLNAVFNNPPIPFNFDQDGFSWNAQYIPDFDAAPPDLNGIPWWNEFGGYDWSFARAATSNSTELVRFEVHPYDSDVIVTGDERSERGSALANGAGIPRGGSFETFAQFMVEPGPVQSGSWALTFQIHYNNSSVPDVFFLMLLNDQFQVQTQSNVGAGGYQATPIPFTRGTWYAMRVSGFWSKNGKSDTLQVWLGQNGSPLPQVVKIGGTNLYATDDTGSYLKQGLYRGYPGENAGNLAIQIANHQISLKAGAFAPYVTKQPPLPVN
jgi:Alpha-L-arabinofuranosidase B, catalytic/Polysaccharide lyase